MESTIISESIINGSKVLFYAIGGTPIGDIFIVSAADGNRFFESREEAKAMYVRKAKSLLV